MVRFMAPVGNRRGGRTEGLPCPERGGRRDRRHTGGTTAPVLTDTQLYSGRKELDDCVSGTPSVYYECRLTWATP
jgi:hypothetical protein